METAPGGRADVLDITHRSEGVSSGGAYFHANEYLRIQHMRQLEHNLISSRHRRATYLGLSRSPTNLSAALRVLGDQLS